MKEPDEQTLRALASRIFGFDVTDVPIDRDIVDELGVDSLSGLRFLAAVEKEYGVRFPDGRLAEFHTLESVLEHISREESA